MPSRADLDEFVKANRAVRRLTRRELEALFARLEGLPPARLFDALAVAVPLLVERFGEVAAMVAADFYEAQREAARVARRFTPALAPVSPVEALVASLRWSMVPMFEERPDGRTEVVGRLLQVADDRVIGQGKRTLVEAAQSDPVRPRVARVPVGVTCAFCRMLAGRGAVYGSAASALAASHAGCDCVPTPMWDGSELPDGFDPDTYRAEYEAARDVAGSNRRRILAEMRREGSTG